MPVVADLEIPPRGLVGETAANRLQAVGLKKRSRLGDEDDAAAVGESGRGDSLVVHTELLPERVIDRVQPLERQGRFHIHVLVGDVLFLEEDGGLLLDAFRHLGMPPENSEQPDCEEDHPANHNNCSFGSFAH